MLYLKTRLSLAPCQPAKLSERRFKFSSWWCAALNDLITPVWSFINIKILFVYFPSFGSCIQNPLASKIWGGTILGWAPLWSSALGTCLVGPCVNPSLTYIHTTPANPPNVGRFQQWRVTQSLPLDTLAGWILYTVTELDINACLGQVDFLKEQVKEENFTCPTGQLIWLKHLIAPKFRWEWFWFYYIQCKRRLIMDNHNKVTPVEAHTACLCERISRRNQNKWTQNCTQKKDKNVT